MAKEWLGGEFVWAPQWSSGKSNDGAYKKKFGNAASARKGRFNPNPTVANHPGCLISARSKADKKNYENSPRIIKYIKSGLMKG